MTYDLIIIGGGPAATGAGVYAARKQLNTLVVAKEFAGQSVVSPKIYNWIGTKTISGRDLANSLTEHLKSYEGDTLSIIEGQAATQVACRDSVFVVTTDDGAEHMTKTVLVATGAGRKKLRVPGADTYEHKGLTYCASCDGPLFAGKDVAVIGGGNAGFETAAQLLAYAKSVALLEYGPQFKADGVTVQKVLAHKNMKALTNAETLEVCGERMVTCMRYKDTGTGDEHTLPVEGIFVEIGVLPNTDLVADLVELCTVRQIKVDPRNQRTSQQGVWAAGDCTDGLYEQNNIAVGDAIKAVEDIYVYLATQ